VIAALLAAPGTGAVVDAVAPGGEQLAFWILAPLALLGAAGMVFSRGAVHSALWLVLTMLCLGCIYIAQQAEFLGFVQIIVYTGAIMMLFLFVLMLTGREAGDSVFEVLRRQRVIGTCVGIGLVGLLVTGLLQALDGTPTVGLDGALAGRGPVGSISELIFTDFLFPFELTSALLITAAVGAMVLTHVEKSSVGRKSQRQRVQERMRSGRMSPLPGPGVFATSSSNATPALLPDGSIAPESVSALVERSESERVARAFREGRSLTGIESVHRMHDRAPVGPPPVAPRRAQLGASALGSAPFTGSPGSSPLGGPAVGASPSASPFADAAGLPASASTPGNPSGATPDRPSTDAADADATAAREQAGRP
jgi:NADH-quinone oxidoreductase subunit J